MDNKNVLITGVLGGMGYATAKAFLAKGYKVFGIDTKDECDLDVEYFKADLTDLNQVNKAFNQISAKTQKLDMICHFTGIYNMHAYNGICKYCKRIII